MSSKFEQLYDPVGFGEDNMHLLKSRIDNIVINMCKKMHVYENYDNDYDHNCHQRYGIDIDDLRNV